MTARQVAIESLDLVRRGLNSSSALDRILNQSKNVSDQDRALSAELMYGVLRWQYKIDLLLKPFVNKPLEHITPVLLDILRLGIYQLFFLGGIAPHAAVHETVQLVKKSSDMRATGFVNAILREMDRCRDNVKSQMQSSRDTVKGIAFSTSFPLWIVALWEQQFGLKKTRVLCESSNEKAPLCIRVNALKTSREAYLENMSKHMSEISIKATALSPVGISIEKGVSVRALPFFNEGYFQVQDEASQLVSLALDPKKNDIILDACAAPGGKTLHLAALIEDQGRVVALDRSAKKINKIKENIERLQLKSVACQTEDFLKYKTDLKFDRILVDAPCTALGSLRRRPEAKWQKQPSDIAKLAQVQLNLLNHAIQFLKPQGNLVYSVCTFTKEETQGVVAAFLAQNANLKLVQLGSFLPAACSDFIQDNGTLQILPDDHQMDGFFMAKLNFNQ